jgi:S1-C subfamily serine protease
MHGIKSFFATSFGSAVLGGLVVAAAGLVAIEAGWVGDDDSDSASAAPLTRPVSDGNDKGLSVNEIYDRYSNGVAFIQAGQASGSGFVIDDDGHILTNAHVVEAAGDDIQVEIGDDGETRKAEVVGTDPSSDVALLKVEESDDLTKLALGDSSSVEVGDPVVAIGNPFGLDRTVTAGIVSAKQRQIQAPNGFSISDVIQTDAAVNPGNSGGPLLNASGEVIGINSQIASSGGGNEGVAFAVPIATAQDVVDQLLEDGSVQRAYLGISGGDITAEAAEALNLPVDHGVIVESTVQNGPADQAGIKGATGEAVIGGQPIPQGGDIITKVNGKDIDGMEAVISLVNEASPGDELTLTVLSGEDERELKVKLGERPAEIEDAAAPSVP